MAILVLFAATTEGCGLLIVKGPPEGHEQMDYFTCDEGDAGPILDLVSAGLNIGTAILCAADPDSYEDSYYGSGACVALGLGSGALLGTSAAVGFGKTKKCREAKRQLAERQAQQSVPAEEEPSDIRVQSVILTPSADSLTVGERLQMTASAYNSSGAIIPNRMFAWSSSNDAIASVSSAGLVTAHATGEVVIAARTGDIVGTARLIVVARH
jgi:hypothetical protein